MEKFVLSQDYSFFLVLLRKIRKQSGLTQQQLAQKLNQSQSFVSKCERGERRIDIVEMRNFCMAMGVSLRSFIEELELGLADEGTRDE